VSATEWPRRSAEATVDQRILIERAQRGDHDAFAELIDPAIARLDAASRLILRDRELARDAVQEAFIRAWRDIRGLRDLERFDAWLYRLTVNACLDIARRRRRVMEVTIHSLQFAGQADIAADLVQRETVDEALSTLDPGHRAVVALHYLLDLPLREVADVLGIPLGTAKSRLHHSVRTMRSGVIGNADSPRSAAPGGQVA
jgi:RNA polymerase sigma-70 factor, ECF subfamily